MATYNYIKTAANLTRLQKELTAIIPVVHCVHFEDSTVIVNTTRDLTEAEQILFAQAITNHAPVITRDVVNGKINNAIRFGAELLVEFATDNVMLGITQSGKTRIVADYCSDIMRYIQSGSLYEAMNEIDRLVAAGIPAELSPFVNDAKLLAFKAKIAAFLA